MERRLELARRLALVLAGALVGLHFAPLGFMPLDQSICFDGGWRLLCGQVPMRDYVAPNGFPVHALQALFFAVFGTTWFAFCLHAAVVNGLAVGLVDRLLDLLGLERMWSSVFALCTAFVFTPPFGVPYMDTHAFFFSLAALVCAVSAARAESATVRKFAAFATGPLLAAAYLSKQIPSVFFLPVVLLVVLWAREERLGMLKRVLASLAISAAALAALAFALGVDWELVRLHWLDLPSEEGARRLQFVPSFGDLAKRFAQTRTELGLHGPTAAFLVALALSAVPVGLGKLYPRELQRLVWPRAALGAALALAGLLFIAWTSNQKAIGVPLVFASAGCTAAAFQMLSRSQREAGRDGLRLRRALLRPRDRRDAQGERPRVRRGAGGAFGPPAATRHGVPALGRAEARPVFPHRSRAARRAPQGARRWPVPRRRLLADVRALGQGADVPRAVVPSRADVPVDGG